MMTIKMMDRFVLNSWINAHTLGLMGVHGIGKTTYVYTHIRKLVAQKEGVPIERVHVISRCVSVLDPADFIGGFVTFGGRTYNCPPDWIPVCKSYDDEKEKLYKANGQSYARLTNYNDVYVLFLDECMRGTPTIQDSVMELLLEHRIFGVDLHEKCYIVCADNDNIRLYNGTKRDPAQLSRIKCFHFMPSTSEFMSNFTEHRDAGLLHPVIINYLNENNEFIVLDSKVISDLSAKNQKGPCPRDWTQLGEILQNSLLNNDDIVKKATESQECARYLAEISSGYIGEAYAAKFAQYCADHANDCLSPHDLVYNSSVTKDDYEAIKKVFRANETRTVTFGNDLIHQLAVKFKDTVLDEETELRVLKFLEISSSGAIVSFYKEWNKVSKAQAEGWKHSPKRYALINGAVMNKRKHTDGTESAYDRWVTSFKEINHLSDEDMKSDTVRV